MNRSLRAFSLAINGHCGYLGASLWCQCGLSFGLRWPSIYSRYLYRLPTVFPSVVFHSALCAFLVGFSFIDNFLIDALVCFCPHRVFNLPCRCHRPFLFHLSFPSLLLLIVHLLLSCVLFLYPLCSDCRLRILEFPFSPLAPPEGPPPQSRFCSLKSSSALVTVLTTSNHSPSSMYSRNQSRRNTSSGIYSSIIFLHAIPVTLTCMLRFSIFSKNFVISLWYLTKPICVRIFRRCG